MGVRPGDGEDRREFLKRASAVVGATVWAVPTMQIVRMASAGAQTTGSVVATTAPPASTTRPPTVETLSFTGHVRRPNPCNGVWVEGPETTTVVVETSETSGGPHITVRVTLNGAELFDESGNRYSLAISAHGTFSSPMDQYVFTAPTEEWSSDTAPDFRYLDGVHTVFMRDGRPVRHGLGGGTAVCIG